MVARAKNEGFIHWGEQHPETYLLAHNGVHALIGVAVGWIIPQAPVELKRLIEVVDLSTGVADGRPSSATISLGDGRPASGPRIPAWFGISGFWRPRRSLPDGGSVNAPRQSPAFSLLAEQLTDFDCIWVGHHALPPTGSNGHNSRARRAARCTRPRLRAGLGGLYFRFRSRAEFADCARIAWFHFSVETHFPGGMRSRFPVSRATWFMAASDVSKLTLCNTSTVPSGRRVITSQRPVSGL